MWRAGEADAVPLAGALGLAGLLAPLHLPGLSGAPEAVVGQVPADHAFGLEAWARGGRGGGANWAAWRA